LYPRLCGRLCRCGPKMVSGISLPEFIPGMVIPNLPQNSVGMISDTLPNVNFQAGPQPKKMPVKLHSSKARQGYVRTKSIRGTILLFYAFSGSIVSSVLILAGNFLLSAFCYCYPATNRSPRGAADGEATHKRNKHGTNWGLKRGSRGGLAG